VKRLGAAALTLLCAAAAAQPARPAAAQACIACHGANGLSVAPDAPHLAGQPEIYLAAQLRAYRSGKRAHEVMNVVAKPLSDDEITSLAAWFASIKVEAKPP
jgi:cytochrome c553